jgi:hypothetical protein
MVFLMRGTLNNLSILILSLLLIPFFVQAYTEDFNYESYSQIGACACTNFAIDGQLINLADSSSIYYITESGTASAWSASVPRQVSLINTGDSATISTLINVPCDAKGDYTLYTHIKTALGYEKVHLAVINVKKCQVISIVPIKKENTVCAGDTAVYEFKLKNNGPYQEKILPYINNTAGDSSNFNKDEYIINPSEEDLAYLYITSNEISGINDYDVKFNALKSGFTYTVPIKYSASSCIPDLIDKEPESGHKKTLFPGFGAYLSTAISRADAGLLKSIALGLFILLLLLTFVVLFVKAMKKRKKDRSLKKWIVDEDGANSIQDDNIKKTEKKAEEIAQRRAEKKAEKIAQRRAEKKQAKKLKQRKLFTNISDEKKKNLKNILLVLLIILLVLLMLGVSFFLIYTYWPEGGFGFFGSGTNETTMPSNESLSNATSMINETGMIDTTGIGDGSELTNATSISQKNPIIQFFTSYSNSCAIAISIFILFFVFSLLLLGTKEEDKWKSWQKKLFIATKYALPVLLFACVVFSFFFCVFNNTCDEKIRCAEITVDGISCEELSVLNITNTTGAVLDRKSIPVCIYDTFFKDISLLWILIILLIILFILAIIFLIYHWRFIIGTIKSKKKKASKIERDDNKDKKKELKKEEIKNSELKREIKAEKKAEKIEKKATATAKSSKIKPEKEEGASLWKDLLILLLLLLFLIGIAAFFHYYNPFKGPGQLNDTNETNITLNLTNVTGVIPISDSAEQEGIIPDEEKDSEEEMQIEGEEDVDPIVAEIDALISYADENNLTETFFFFIIEEGRKIEVDLNLYFIDPDGDELFFTVENKTSDNISIDIWKGVATIQPDLGFIGIANVTFVAEDPLGESVSGITTIIVKPKDEKSLSSVIHDMFLDLYWYVLVGIALIVLIIVVLIIFFAYRRKPKNNDLDPDGKEKGPGFFKEF